jgi:hypothetical protein
MPLKRQDERADERLLDEDTDAHAGSAAEDDEGSPMINVKHPFDPVGMRPMDVAIKSSTSISESRRIGAKTLAVMCIVAFAVAFLAGRKGMFRQQQVDILTSAGSIDSQQADGSSNSDSTVVHATTHAPIEPKPQTLSPTQQSNTEATEPPSSTSQQHVTELPSAEPTETLVTQALTANPTQTLAATNSLSAAPSQATKPQSDETLKTQSPSTTRPTDDVRLEDLPACNADQLFQIVAKSKWRYKTADELENPNYGPRCRFLFPRYSCDRANTSANDMALEYSEDEMRKLGCHVPDYHAAIDQLIEQNRNLFLCGDSHITQIYVDVLCTFQRFIRKVDYTHATTKTVKVRWTTWVG